MFTTPILWSRTIQQCWELQLYHQSYKISCFKMTIQCYILLKLISTCSPSEDQKSNKLCNELFEDSQTWAALTRDNITVAVNTAAAAHKPKELQTICWVTGRTASTANNNVCSSETNGTDEEMMSQSVTYSLSAWWGKKLSKYVLWHHVVYLVNDQDVLNKIIS